MSETILISELRAKIMSDPTTKAMLTPSSRNAIFLDVDGDGPADFGFLCSDLKGDVLDTIAVDFTNDGDFDFYIYNCQNPENAYCVYYAPGSNVPMLLTKAQMTNTLAMLIPMLDAIHNFDAAAFAKFFKGMKAAIVAHFADAGSSANKTVLISDLRAKIEGSAETKAMIRPAGKNAVLVDIDADGPADFAFLCSDVKGNMLDTIAIDLTGEGLFNLYLYNCLNPDGAELVYYPADVNAPAEVVKEGELYEKTMAVAAKAVDALFNFNAATFGETFRGLKKQMIAFSEKK